jgi:flagellar hook-associated protein 1 FlgK
MAGLFGSLDASARALMVTQRGIATTSHNIANASTPGYSRQRQLLEAAPALATSAGRIGTGVQDVGIQRFTDEFVQRQLVQEDSTKGSLDAQASVLTQIDAVLNEQQIDGIAAELSKFYSAFADLASTPTPGAPSERTSLRTVANSLISSINRGDARLRDIQRATDRGMADLLPEINSLAQQIADLNGQIIRQSALAAPNDLLDQRDQLLRQLSGKVEISSFTDDRGGEVVLLSGGVPLVNGKHAAQLTAEADPTNTFDPTFSQVFYNDGANVFDVTADIGGGELGGLLRARDTILADAIRQLDAVAYNLIETVNAVHSGGAGRESAPGLGDGALGVNFFAPLAQVEDSARAISLDALILASTDNIAAADVATGGGASDNRNALRLADLEGTRAATFELGDPPGGPTGPTSSVVELTGTLLADIGQEVRNGIQARTLQESIVQGLEDRRDETSGVSLDEEVTDLIRLQAAFQANARVITTLDRLLEQLVNLI